MPHNQGDYYPPFQGSWNNHVPPDPVEMGNGNNSVAIQGQGHPTVPPGFLASNFDIPYYHPGRNAHPYSTVQSAPPSLPAPSLPPLAHRASVPSMRLAHHAQQGMAIGHGAPPHFHAPANPGFWQVPPHPPSTPVGMSQTAPTLDASNVNLPPSPIYNGSSPRQESNLFQPFDGVLMSRVNSYSSAVSSPSDRSYYTPISGSEGGDYFAHDRELRSVSATVGGHYPRVDALPSYASSAPMPGTISLSRIQGERLSLKVEPAAPSVTDSEPASPAMSIHSSPAPVVKPEYPSPQSHQLSSPVASNPHGSPAHPEGYGAAFVNDAPHPPRGDSSSFTPLRPYALNDSEEDDDNYVTDDDHDDDDFHLNPPKGKGTGRKQKKKGLNSSRNKKKKKRSGCSPRGSTSVPTSSAAGCSSRRQARNSENVSGSVSRAALLNRYPRLPQDFPLLFRALEPDLSIDERAAPKIGTIPKTVTPETKGEILQRFYHRGRRVIQQMDAFAILVKPRTTCGRKIEASWLELSLPYGKALIAVRRKIVERTENYKYTRRDTLRKFRGRCCATNNAACIEFGMIRWDPESGNNDPAMDLEHWGTSVGPDNGSSLPAQPSGVVQHVASQLGQLDIRPVQSRSTMRSSTRPQPAPIIVHHSTSCSHARSYPPPGSANIPNYPSNTIPLTPVSAVSTDGSILGVSTPVGEFNSDPGHLTLNVRMSIDAGSGSNSFGDVVPPSPLPSPSALGLSVGPSGRAPAMASIHPANQMNKGRSRSYSTDSEWSSWSTVDYE
ncbi:hypothetical protein CspHIS471_0408400 [Cutaneotrichosporon sp. HIS471]|nr:hypothetical protein CspHIS471_0408400 [Cutaneotrichosporon sp. HIS471]